MNAKVEMKRFTIFDHRGHLDRENQRERERERERERKRIVMSGVYLNLWDEELRDNSVVLRPVKSGWPHITLAYTNKLLPVHELAKIAQVALAIWAMKPVTVVRAYVNTFNMIPSGNVRHDVLLELDPQTTEAIAATRQTHVVPYEGSDQFVMRTPHVTHSIHPSQESAQAMADSLNQTYLPKTVTVTGVSM